jgi:hypothetical protein
MKTKIILIISAAFLLAMPAMAAESSSAEDTASLQAEPQTPDAPSEAGASGEGAMFSLPAESALPPVSPSAIGGAFSSLMTESFKTDLATGAATLSVPIVAPPGRKNVQPNIALSYSSNNPNGACGVGWSLTMTAIQRSTKNGVPRYDNTDTFTAGGEELVNIGGGEYRAKIESSFTKYVYSSHDNSWLAVDKSGTRYYFGEEDGSRMSQPNNPARTFAWYLDKAVDVYVNTITYSYEKSDNTLYPGYVEYTSNPLCSPPLNADKRIEFIWEEAERPDKIYNYRAGWPSIMKKRLEKICVSADGVMVWTYNLSYVISPDTSRSLLKSVQLADGAGNTLPAKTFTYQRLEP